MSDNRHGYKAYNPGLVCRGYQYKENEVFKKNGHGICVPGVTHYCVNPFDVLDFYPLVNDDGKFSDFTTVEAIDEPVTDDNKKFATSAIKIGVKLGLDGSPLPSTQIMMVRASLASASNLLRLTGKFSRPIHFTPSRMGSL